jgi:hypothetical protein
MRSDVRRRSARGGKLLPAAESEARVERQDHDRAHETRTDEPEKAAAAARREDHEETGGGAEPRAPRVAP